MEHDSIHLSGVGCQWGSRINPHTAPNSRLPQPSSAGACGVSCCAFHLGQQGASMCPTMWLDWPILVTLVSFSVPVMCSYFLKSHRPHHVPMNHTPLPVWNLFCLPLLSCAQLITSQLCRPLDSRLLMDQSPILIRMESPSTEHKRFLLICE